MVDRDVSTARNSEQDKDLPEAGEANGGGDVKSVGSTDGEKTQGQNGQPVMLTVAQGESLSVMIASAMNQLFAADPAAIGALLSNRMPVSSALVDLGVACDSVPVLVGGRTSVQFPAVTVLTLVNVALGAAGLPSVAMMTGKKSGELRGFIAVRKRHDGVVEPILPAVDQASGQTDVASAGETPT